ncbi:MAG: S8 family serine peptidase [Rhodothermaceae bacterium]|nr:S8 family serine peptidase [Rhodothermaceae bacterium]MXY23175.1 S8 family serine peptidase [Acidobacteriota bacterium]MXZ57864.1 S8 family serine peptidase [Rhodothermaceae bacterium]MYD68625.1 S8 family serine peptidase [Rhodothermaceae bacterium]MYJ06940.1 S8 family serine peptidase [Rhodothermaceae bacterium]
MMGNAILKLALLLAGIGLSVSSRTAAQVQFPGPSADVVPNVVLVQFTDGIFPVGKRSGLVLFDAIANTHGVYALVPAFPYLQRTGISCDNAGELSNVYRAHFSEATPPEILALAFESDPGVVYAEAEYYYKTTGSVGTSVPNDPDYNYQTAYMKRLQLEKAWDVVKGEQGEVVVAILDSGTDWRHEDLIANVWTNSDEIPDNGIDDDGNGYIDDVHGYDLENRMPYTPSVTIDLTSNNHGTAVASVASGESNNGKGVAGSSWNAAYMPLGADCGGGGICHIAEGILYAAANGADIINGSFSSRSYSRTNHLAVQCAMEMGTLFVAGAGNNRTNNDAIPSYPASLNETLAVGGTEKNWDRVVFNYGSTVDVFASAIDVATAVPNNQYERISGTSFSSPMVAGIAALVKTRFPRFSAEQVREQLRYTADTIESSNSGGFEGLLGRGRVNAYSAVRAPVPSAIRAVGVERRGSTNDSSPSFVVKVESYFGNGTNQSASVELVDVPSYMGFESTLQRIDFPTGAGVGSVTFPFSIPGDIPYRVTDLIEIRITHGGGVEKLNHRFESRSGETLPVYNVNEDTWLLGYSITSEGNLGYLDRWGHSAGMGIYIGTLSKPIDEAGLIIGTSPNQISSSVIGYKGSHVLTQPVHFNRKPGTKMEVYASDANGIVSTEVTLSDSNAPNPIEVEILEETQFVTDENDPSGGFIIVKYTITNPHKHWIDNLHVGLYIDWLVSLRWNEDQPRFDVERQAIYQISAEPGVISTASGIKVLSEDFDIRYGALLNYGIYPGLTWNEIIWEYLSGENRLGFPTADNWSSIASVGPVRLGPGAHEEVAFALVSGKDEAAWLKLVDRAVDYWENGVRSYYGNLQIINNTESQLELYLDDAQDVPNRIPARFSSDYISIPVGPARPRVDNSMNDLSLVSNLEVKGDSSYQIIYRSNADQSQIHSTIVCCARDHAMSEDIVALRVVHTLTGQPDLGFRFISDQGFVYAVQVAEGAASSYIDIRPDIYSLEVSKNGKPWLRNSEIDFTSLGGEVLLITLELSSLGLLISAYGAKYGRKLYAASIFEEIPSISTEQPKLPPEFVLHGNYPNPVNSSMRIHFDLPYSARVYLEIVDLLGKCVREVFAGEVGAGFDASISVDSQGLSSGVYLYRLTAQSDVGTFTNSGKFIVIR